MPLAALFPFLNLITGRVWVYLVLVGLASSFVGGYYVKSKFEQAKQVTAINLARSQERDAATIGNVASHRYLSTLRQREKDANVKINQLRKRLAAVPACPVPVPDEWLRDERVSSTATDARRARPTGENLATADARDVVLTCERNRLEVHQPNAEQIEAMRQWYRALRDGYNR